MNIAAYQPAPLNSGFRRNAVRTFLVDAHEGTTKFGMLRSTLGPDKGVSNAREVSTRSGVNCVVTTHNGDLEV